jgi:hypothetical protein
MIDRPEDKILRLYEDVVVTPLKEVMKTITNFNLNDPKWSVLMDFMADYDDHKPVKNLIEMNELKKDYPKLFAEYVKGWSDALFEVCKRIDNQIKKIEKLPDKSLDIELLTIFKKILTEERKIVAQYVANQEIGIKGEISLLKPEDILTIIDENTKNEQIQSMKFIIMKEYLNISREISNALMVVPTNMANCDELSKRLGHQFSNDKEYNELKAKAMKLNHQIGQAFVQSAEKIIKKDLLIKLGISKYDSDKLEAMGFIPIIKDIAIVLLNPNQDKQGIIFSRLRKALAKIQERAEEYEKAEPNSPLKGNEKRRVEAEHWKVLSSEFDIDRIIKIAQTFSRMNRGTDLLYNEYKRVNEIKGENSSNYEELAKIVSDHVAQTKSSFERYQNLSERANTVRAGRVDRKVKATKLVTGREMAGLNSSGYFTHRNQAQEPHPHKTEIEKLEDKAKDLPPLPHTPGRKT